MWDWAGINKAASAARATRAGVAAVAVGALLVATLGHATWNSSIAQADVSSLTITPASQTVQLGTAMTTTSVTATPGPVINQIPALRTVRTLAGPTGANVSPTNVTTTELDGIRGIVQESSGDFIGLLGTTSLVRIARATGAVTALTYTPGSPITGQGLGIDSSDRLYVQQDDRVVQLNVSGTTVTESGAKATFEIASTPTAPTAFQVTGAGRVYGLFAGGVITTADISSGNTSVAATGYLTNSDWGSGSSDANSGPTGLYVQETVAGNPADAQVYVVTDYGALVLQVQVAAGVASGGQRVSPFQNTTSVSSSTSYSPTTMDGAGNLYWMYQNCVLQLPTGIAPRDAVPLIGDIVSGQCRLLQPPADQNITASSGYVDGAFGTSRINAGWVAADGTITNPPVAHGGLVIDIKGTVSTEITGRLMIADTNNKALRSMDRVGWGVTPELYNGLTLNTDGSISGTPTGTSGLNSSNNVKTYTLSYSNADGSVVTQNTTITLTAAPSSFTYQFPGVWSGNDSWFAISDNVGGQIWGTIGTGQFTINQAIVEACPSTLGTGQASTRTSLTCGTSDLITNASLGIPTATTWSISPALPTGVTFDTSTGGISGTPTVYSPVQTYTVTAANGAGSATTTFSFGVPQPATVTFDANGGSGSMSPQTSVGATSLNNNTFTPPTGQVFTGWNTQANGGGTSYANGANYPFTADETLYAQWAPGYVIQYDAGTGGSGTISDSGPYLSGTPGSATGQYWGFTPPAGQIFAGWNTQANGTGDYYWFGASVIATSDLTLYAQWFNAPAATYTYTYDVNGGTWSGAPTPTVADGSNSYMPSSAADPSLARTGWTANGWNTKADGSGGFIAFTDQFVNVYADLTVYANWSAQITYDANDPNATGNTPVDPTQYFAPQSVTVSNQDTLAVAGLQFDSWNTQANGSGTSYAPGDTLTLAATGNLTLYAQWVVPGPSITSQPADDTQNVGATATFSVAATASAGTLSYQWETKPSGGSWGNASGGSGATTASYTTPTLSSADDSAQYRVVVTDSNGSTTSNAATLTVISPPGAPNQPTVSSYGNATATIAVTAGAGGTPASYSVTPSPLPSSAPTTCTVSGASGSCSFNNLTNGTAYTFSATATNQAGTSVASPASSSVTPLAPPGQPGQPTAAVTGATSATVTITAPSTGGPPTTYTVTPTPAPGTAPTTCTVTAPATTCSFSNLTGGTSYTFAATATNVGGTSIASPSSSSTQISAPGTPGAPTAVAGPASATVTVVAPSTGGPPSTYLVTSSPAGGTCTVTVPATSCVVSGLAPGTSYTFTSTATNGIGTSGSSGSSNAVTPTANVAPGTPGAPTAVASNGGATVTVVAPGSGGTPSSYAVTASPTPSSGSATCTVTVPATSCAFNNLTNGTAYTFTSTATNIVGTSGSSAASSPVTPLATPGTPGQPLAAAASATSATVTITAPTTGGAPANYLVTASGGGGQTCTVTSPSTSCTVTGLTSGGSYTFTSTATNVGGTSGSSVPSASITLSAPGVPGTPTALAGAGSATVSITPPSSGGTPSSYTVTSSPAGGTCTVTVPATSCVVAGLTPGTSYTFTSTATNGLATSGASAASNAVTPTSPTPPTPPTPVTPSAPSSVSVAAGAGSATVSWSAPANPGTFAVTQYRVIASPGGVSCLVPASSTTCTLSPLTNGTTYTVAVSALSGAGWGAAATSAPFTPGASVPATPSVTSVIAGNGSVTVSVVAGPGGGPVTSYLVTSAPGGASCTVTAPRTSCAVTGLTNGTAYTFTATATGPGGTSGSSQESNAATPVDPITPTPAPLPAPLTPGQSNLQQGGQTVPVTVTPNGQSNGLVVNAPGFTMTLQGENSQGRPLPLTNGVLVLEQDRTLRTSGSGFFPDTEVEIYLNPPAFGDGSMLRANAGAIYLGSVRTNSLGEFNGTVQIDPSVGVGDHVVQAIGVTQNNVERAMSLGVRVVEEVAKRPGPVRDLVIVKKRPTSVTLSWKIPANDGGSRITEYRVRHRLLGQPRYRGRLDVTGLTATVKGLTPGKVYYIRVKAVNAVGVGPSDTFIRVRLPRG